MTGTENQGSSSDLQWQVLGLIVVYWPPVTDTGTKGSVQTLLVTCTGTSGSALYCSDVLGLMVV